MAAAGAPDILGRMIRKTRVGLVAAALFGAAAVTAQVPKGTAAPAFDFKAVLNDGPASFDDLAGKVVILDFGETW